MNDAISYDSPEEAGVPLLSQQNRLAEARNRCQAGCAQAVCDLHFCLGELYEQAGEYAKAFGSSVGKWRLSDEQLKGLKGGLSAGAKGPVF